MRPILTAAQMREVDRLTTERYGIPSISLMENAALAVARVIKDRFGGSAEGRSILILCGKGNNGGDGAALGRLLAAENATVETLLFGNVAVTKGDARMNFERAGESAARLTEINSPEEFSAFFDGSAQVFEVVVDAIFGTGLDRPVDGWLGEVLQKVSDVSEQAQFTLSIDIPSGLNADLSDPIGATFKADTTVTFTAAKTANVLPPASTFGGELVIADIGSPQELIEKCSSDTFLAEAADAGDWLKATRFSTDSYKNKRGHALVIAGSESYSGAAVLAANAAMRSGVGLVTLAAPRSSLGLIAPRLLPEVMLRGVTETDDGEISESAFDEIGGLLAKADSIAIGCGLSQSESTRRFVEKVVACRRQPMVVDADALNLLSPVSTNWPPAHAGDSDKSALTKVRASSTLRAAHAGGTALILTPHEGEFMRLLGTTDRAAIKDRVHAVREFATTHNVILVLKGERVLIGAPDGRVVVNPTGNSGLGKAGNGDTLTGILAGFAAQAAVMNIDIFETVVAAVYVAGLAGDIAESKYGKRVMTASDVRECLADVFAKFEV